MKIYLQDYIKEIDKLLKNNKKITSDIIEKHLIKISFFQHERLIHLLVTLFYALFCIIFTILGFVFALIGFFCLYSMYSGQASETNSDIHLVFAIVFYCLGFIMLTLNT